MPKPIDLGPIEDIPLFSGAKVEGLDPRFAENLRALAEDFRLRTGRPLNLVSAFRSLSEQTELRRQYEAGERSGPVALPENSLHPKGLAVDLAEEDMSELRKIGLAKYGFHAPIENDPLHMQMLPVGPKDLGPAPVDLGEVEVDEPGPQTDERPSEGVLSKIASPGKWYVESVLSGFKPMPRQREAGLGGALEDPNLTMAAGKAFGGTVADPLIKLLGLPHEKITRPYVVEPLAGKLKEKGLGEVYVPEKSLMIPEAAAMIPEGQMEGEVRVPYADVLAETVGLGADVPVYGTLLRIMRGVNAARKAGTAAKAAVGRAATEADDIARMVDQGLAEVEARSAIGGRTSTRIEAPEVAAIPEREVATKTPEELDAQLKEIEGIIAGREPMMPKPDIQPSIVPGEPGYRPRAAVKELEEPVTTPTAPREVEGVPEEADLRGGWVSKEAAEATLVKEVPEVGTGERGFIKKYYGGGPETEDLVKAARERGAKEIAGLQKIADELSKSFTEHPLYKQREALFDESRRLSEWTPDKALSEANWQRQLELRKELDATTKELFSTEESKKWWTAHQELEGAKTKLDLEEQKIRDLANRANWDKAPQHGTQLDALEGILAEGLKPGSALDYTPNKDWASGYPVRITLPSARRGNKIEHNDFYTSGNTARAAKVELNLDDIVPEAEAEYIAKIRELEKKYPDVEFTVTGENIPLGMSWEEARERDRGVSTAIADWLMGKGKKPAPPRALYRGIPKGKTPRMEEGGYTHGTPWAYSASRGGKGGFGDPSAYDVYSYGADEGTLYYRGGSLAGDPFENTKINSAGGMTWDEVLDQAKALYKNRMFSERQRYSNLPPEYRPTEEDIARIAAERTVRDVRNATFEADLAGRPGIWVDRKVPPALGKERPSLRSNEELRDYIAEQRKLGMPEEDIQKLPEYKILTKKYFSGGPESEEIYNAFKAGVKEPGATPAAVIGRIAEQYKISPGEAASVIKSFAKGGPGTLKAATSGLLAPHAEIIGQKVAAAREAAVEGGVFQPKKLNKAMRTLDPHKDFTESPIRWFQRVDDVSPGFKSAVYDRQKALEHMSKIEADELEGWSRRLQKGLPRGSGERIMTYATAQQKGGKELLSQHGYKVPELTTAEMEAYQAMRGRYDEFYTRINQARKAAGMEPIEPVDNYFTWVRIVMDEALDGISPLGVTPDHYRKVAPSYDYAYKRVKSKLPIVMDAHKVFRRYGKQTINWINQAPHSKAVKELADQLKDAGAPRIAGSLEQWLHNISGWKRPLTQDAKWNRFFNRLGKNIAVSTLSGYLRSATIQPLSLVYANAEIGPINISKGLMDVVNPTMRKFAMEHSNVLRPREFDVHIQQAIEQMLRPGKIRKLQRGAAAAGYWPLKVIDHQAAMATWLGAYRRAGKIGLEGQSAFRYADDVVVRTQGSSIPSDITQIQASEMGKLATMFQTFVINEWNLVSRDILGYHSAVSPTKERVRKAINLITAGTLANVLMEDVVGMPSPMPAPIRAFRKAETTSEGIRQAVGEISTMLPVVGGAYYTGTPFGPMARFGGEVADQARHGVSRKGLFLLAQALGIPGTVQLERLSRVPGKLTLLEALLGKQWEPPGRTRYSRRRRLSRQERAKQDSYMLDPFLNILGDY